MDKFEEDITLIDDDNWLGCFDGDNNVLENFRPFGDIPLDDNFFNLQPELCSLEPHVDSSVQTTFPYDNVSESNSSDSGNYSPKSSSSEQQQPVSWNNAQHQLSPLTEEYRGDFSREFQPNTVDASQSTEHCYYAEDCVTTGDGGGNLNNKDANNNVNGDFTECGFDSTYITPSPSQIYSPESGYVQDQPQQIYYVAQEATGSPNQLMSVSCVNGQFNNNCNNSMQQNLILPAMHNSANGTYTNSPGSYQATPVKLYLNKRPIPRSNTFIQNSGSSSAGITAEEEEFLRRKEDRKLRNRAAAQLSRQRKRNEFEEMKYKLTEKEEECQVLRKKVDELRKKVSLLEEENERLLLRGDCKRRRCDNGSNVFADFERADSAKQINRKKTAVKTAGGVCALVFMAFMFFPSSDYKNDLIQIHSNFGNQLEQHSAYNDGNVRDVPKLPHVGHSLMSLGNYQTSNGTYMNGTRSQTMKNISDITGCPNGNDIFNTTQNIRLNAELLNWIDRHDQMNFVQLRRGNSPSVIFNGRLTTNAMLETQKEFSKIFSETQMANNWTVNRTDLENTTTTNSRKALLKKSKSRVNMPSSMENNDSMEAVKVEQKNPLKADRRRLSQQKQKLQREMTMRHLNMITKAQSNDVLQKHQKMANITAYRYASVDFEQKMLEFTSKIQQKDDTLYVVALKDYFLLPALDNAKSAPKLSIILPALATNTSAAGQLTMMRIECNVVATSVFYLPDSIISLFNVSPPIF